MNTSGGGTNLAGQGVSLIMNHRDGSHPDQAIEPAIPHPEQCPVCDQNEAQEWLRAPDRLHGRRELYTLMRCMACSFVWLSCPPNPEDLHAHYTDAYDKLISATGYNSPNRWRDRKAALSPFKQSGTLLDLGCSSGAFLESMRGPSWRLFGIEMSAKSAQTAETRSGANVFVGDIRNAPFAPGSFDVITCFDVLEHLYEPRRVILKVAEWLKPDGIFYVHVPNIASAEARVFGSYWHGLELPRHLSHFSPTSLQTLTRSAGLSQVSLTTQRNSAVGTSLRYVWDGIFRRIGVNQVPVAYRGQASLPWRAARKLVRVTILPALLATAPLFGKGESIQGIFRRDAKSSGSQI